jgi:DNA-binding MarR family transcriptional regulator
LVLYRDSRDGIARTGQTDIARRAGINRRTVYRALRRLEGRGLVKIVYARGLGRGLSRYRVRGL